jgi:hypothetical protein
MPEASHPHPDINALYAQRRKWADAALGSGWTAIEGWAQMEDIENRLRDIDPDGDWRYEGNDLDGKGWQVRRPTTPSNADHATEGYIGP